MDSPRSIRRKSKVCYKEDDSFIEEFNYNATPKTPTSKLRKSIIKKSSRLTDNSDSESTTCEKEEIFKRNESPTFRNSKEESTSSENVIPSSLVDIRKKSTWNPIIKLEELNISDDVKIYKDSPSIESSVIRRGTRIRHKTTLAKEAEESIKLLKKLSVKNNSRSDSDSDDNEHCLLENPSSLFTEEDVEGKQMFKFKMMHRKQDMVKKAIESVLDSPKFHTKIQGSCLSPRTPKSSQKTTVCTPGRRGRKSTVCTTPKSTKPIINEKTPHHIRNKMKKKLASMALEDDEGTDFEDSGSDFQVSDESQSSDNNSDSVTDDNGESDNEVLTKVKSKIKAQQTPSKPYSLRKPRGDKDSNYIVKSDDYFSMHGSKKVVTSNHTLERLKTPRLTEDKLQNILKQQKLSEQHKIAIEELMEDHQKLFDKWMYILNEGFSILLHGVGSKLKLITDFQLQKLSNYPCIVINGFFPSLTLKDILESIISDLLNLSSVPSNVYEAVKVIDDEMTVLDSTNLFLLIHNIDGTMLRNNKTQYVLSKLARIKNVHLIASVDHINAPLIWDHSVLSNFNFSWWDATTLLPYTQETSFESSLLVHNSGALALSSFKNVFQSLTTNARGIFMIIVKNQLKNKKTPHYQGISFKDLYWSARESFFVSSDLALRAQLTEFLDHKLVKTKRTVDGVEHLVIPIDNALLQLFMEQNV